MEQVKAISEKYNAQLDSIIEFMMPDITATFGDFSTDKIKEKLGKPVINYDNGGKNNGRGFQEQVRGRGQEKADALTGRLPKR